MGSSIWYMNEGKRSMEPEKVYQMDVSKVYLLEAEAELEKDGQLHDARTALASLRRKRFG